MESSPTRVMLTLAQEKALRERIAAAIAATGSQGMTIGELSAVFEGFSYFRCQRLLFRLMGDGRLVRTYEPRGTKRSNGTPYCSYVYRDRKQ